MLGAQCAGCLCVCGHMKVIGLYNLKMIRYLLIVLMILGAVMSSVVEAQSARELLSSARRGDPVAMRKLGVCLYFGRSAPRNVGDAVGWWKKAADRGDARSMLYLGDLYMNGTYFSKNRKKAIELYRKAAAGGDEKALERLERFGEPITEDGAASERPARARRSEPVPEPEVSVSREREPKPAPVVPTPPAPVVQPSAPDADVVLDKAVGNILSGARRFGIQDISVITFLHNGGKTDDLTSSIRSSLVNKLLPASHGNVRIFDREESKLVALESGLSLGGEELTASQGILMGEIFSSPGSKTGVIAYRLFRADNTRIVAAGYDEVRWNADEWQLPGATVRSFSHRGLPQIPRDQFQNLAGLLSGVTCGVAMGQDGGQSPDNTVEMRMAYAQFVPELLRQNICLYEREYYQVASNEQSLSGESVTPGQGIGAVGRLICTSGGEDINKINLRITAIPRGNLLASVNVIQRKGEVANRTGHSAENEFDAYMKELDADNRDVPLVYECEVIISDDYSIPEKYWYEKGDPYMWLNAAWCSDEINTDEKQAARQAFEHYIQDLYREYNGDKRRIKQELEMAALLGLPDEYGALYVGPVALCLIEANKKLQFTDGDGDVKAVVGNYMCDRFKDMTSDRKQSVVSGVVNDNDKPLFTYSTSIIWKGAIPYKVSVKIDFSPARANIIKRKQTK